MDVDIPQNEEAMETDSPINNEHQHPQLTRKDSIIDPDGDEVMQGDEEEVYEEDIEIGEAEGGEEIEAEEEYVEGEGDGDYDVDLEGGDRGIGEAHDESLDTEDGDVGVETGATMTAEELPSALEDDTSAPIQNAETTTTLEEQSPEDTQVETAQGAADVTGQSHAETNEEVTETKLEKSAEQEHAEAEPVEGAHEEEHDIGDEEEEDEYDFLTPETLPPIILNLPNSRIALFNTIPTDPELPLWFSERIEKFCEGTLTQLWGAIRLQLDTTGEGNGEDEMVIIEKLMDLKMGDVSLSSLFLHDGEMREIVIEADM